MAQIAAVSVLKIFSPKPKTILIFCKLLYSFSENPPSGPIAIPAVPDSIFSAATVRD